MKIPKILLFFCFLSSHLSLANQLINDYQKTMHQIFYRDYYLKNIEFSEDNYDVEIKLSKDMEHLCEVQVSQLNKDKYRLSFNSSHHADFKKDLKIFPNTVQFQKDHYESIFQYLVANHDKRSFVRFIFLEEIIEAYQE